MQVQFQKQSLHFWNLTLSFYGILWWALSTMICILIDPKWYLSSLMSLYLSRAPHIRQFDALTDPLFVWSHSLNKTQPLASFPSGIACSINTHPIITTLRFYALVCFIIRIWRFSQGIMCSIQIRIYQARLIKAGQIRRHPLVRNAPYDFLARPEALIRRD